MNDNKWPVPSMHVARGVDGRIIGVEACWASGQISKLPEPYKGMAERLIALQSAEDEKRACERSS